MKAVINVWFANEARNFMIGCVAKSFFGRICSIQYVHKLWDTVGHRDCLLFERWCVNIIRSYSPGQCRLFIQTHRLHRASRTSRGFRKAVSHFSGHRNSQEFPIVSRLRCGFLIKCKLNSPLSSNKMKATELLRQLCSLYHIFLSLSLIVSKISYR